MFYSFLPLVVTVRGLAKCGTFSTTLQSKHQSSNLAQSFIRSTSPRISPNPCYRLPFCRGRELSYRLCGRCIFIFSKRGEEKNEVLVGRERASSFASLGLSVGFVRLANVLVRVLAILQSLPKSL